MKSSPFPGMDAYLESHWSDVHISLIFGARNSLNEVLPVDLAAVAEERTSPISGAVTGRFIHIVETRTEKIITVIDSGSFVQSAGRMQMDRPAKSNTGEAWGAFFYSRPGKDL